MNQSGRALGVQDRRQAASAGSGASDLAFGSSIAGGIAGIAVTGGLLMALGVAGGITLFVIRYVRTSRRRA